MSTGSIVLANLIVGRDGSTTRGGSSTGLSSPEDRKRFHALRARASCILIGGQTARTEPYYSTPVPLYVMTHGELPDAVAANPLARVINANIIGALSAITATEDGRRILIESGPAPLHIALHLKKVDELYITIANNLDGENRIEVRTLTKGYEVVERVDIGEDTFLKLIPKK